MATEVGKQVLGKLVRRLSLFSLPVQIACALAISQLLAAHASAQPDAALSAKAIQWASANLPKYNQAVNFALHGPRPQAPIPPQVDPPCRVCGDNSKTQGEKQVSAWIAASENPEMQYAKTLTGILHDLTILKSVDPGQLSPAAEKALWPFAEDKIQDALAALGSRLLDKGSQMGEKYHREPKRAYAGISFLVQSAHDAMMLLAFQKGGGDSNADNQALEYAREWTQYVIDEIDSKVLSGHQYNLCPVYAEIYRQISLLGGTEPDVARFEQTARKLQDLLKFKITTRLDADVTEPDGGHLNATWESNARLTLKLDLENSCYTPMFDNGGEMSVKVTSWTLQTKAGPVELSSPHQYKATLGSPLLNLCDPRPIFQIPLGNLSGMPQEQVTAQGHTSNITLYSGFLGAILTANMTNSQPTNQLSGSTPVGQGQTSDPPADPNGPSLDSLKAQIAAHSGDMNWMMSPEGQAVVAKLQKAAMNMAQGKLASAGVVTPNVSNLSQLKQSLSSAHLNWTNGQVEPVNQTIHLQKDTARFTLNITVRQAQQ